MGEAQLDLLVDWVPLTYSALPSHPVGLGQLNHEAPFPRAQVLPTVVGMVLSYNRPAVYLLCFLIGLPLSGTSAPVPSHFCGPLSISLLLTLTLESAGLTSLFPCSQDHHIIGLCIYLLNCWENVLQ